MKIKQFLLATVLGLSALASHAGRVDITIGETRHLPSCGGTVTVNNGGNDNQVNVVFRNVMYCKTFVTDSGREYKLQGSKQGEWGGSFTITTANQEDSGVRRARTDLQSGSGAHHDDVNVSFRVVRRY